MKDYHSMSADQMSAELREMAELAPTPDLQECYQRAAALLGGAQRAVMPPSVKEALDFAYDLIGAFGNRYGSSESPDGRQIIGAVDKARSKIRKAEDDIAAIKEGAQEAVERLKRMADCHVVDPTPIDALGRFEATYGDLRAVLAACAVTEGSR